MIIPVFLVTGRPADERQRALSSSYSWHFHAFSVDGIDNTTYFWSRPHGDDFLCDCCVCTVAGQEGRALEFSSSFTLRRGEQALCDQISFS